MRKTAKVISSTFLLLLMIFSFSYLPVEADGEGAISGQIRIDDVYYPMGTPASGSNWSYDGDHILTLDGFEGDVVYYYPEADRYEEQILNVKLVGENKTNYFGVGNEYYDCYRLNVIGNGSIDVATSIPNYMDITSGTVIIHSVGGRYVNIKQKGQLDVHTTFSGSNLLGINLKARVDGGTMNVFTTGRYLTWPWKDSLRVVNGGTVNVTTNGDEYYGGIMAQGDSHFWTDYTITDFAGNPTVQLDKRLDFQRNQ